MKMFAGFAAKVNRTFQSFKSIPRIPLRDRTWQLFHIFDIMFELYMLRTTRSYCSY